jgi:hypothetical protein
LYADEPDGTLRNQLHHRLMFAQQSRTECA